MAGYPPASYVGQVWILCAGRVPTRKHKAGGWPARPAARRFIPCLQKECGRMASSGVAIIGRAVCVYNEGADGCSPARCNLSTDPCLPKVWRHQLIPCWCRDAGSRVLLTTRGRRLEACSIQARSESTRLATTAKTARWRTAELRGTENTFDVQPSDTPTQSGFPLRYILRLPRLPKEPIR